MLQYPVGQVLLHSAAGQLKYSKEHQLLYSSRIHFIISHSCPVCHAVFGKLCDAIPKK